LIAWISGKPRKTRWFQQVVDLCTVHDRWDIRRAPCASIVN